MILNVEIEVCESYPLILKEWIKGNFKEDVGPKMGFNGLIGIFQIGKKWDKAEWEKHTKSKRYNIRLTFQRKHPQQTRTQNQQHQLETIYALYTEV